MVSRTEELVKKRNEHVPQAPFNTHPAFVKRASGSVLIDVEDREFIDFTGGIGVLNVGHCHHKVVEAIKNQVEKYIHTCFHVTMYDIYIDLAEKLNKLAPGNGPKKTMFANSGAEAVENAVKVVRYHTKRPAIICFENAFHGRTLLGMSLTSKIKPYKLGFGPFAPEIYRMPFAYCYRCPFNLNYPGCDIACAEYLESFFINQVAPESTAAVIAEPIQGEGGFITPPLEYFKKLHGICKKYEIPLIIDEVQSGTGRTGKFFAIEHWGIEPDLVILAKSLAGGMPLSSITGNADMMDNPHVGGLGGTYAGNPVCCRAALAVLDILLEDELMERGEKIGGKFLSRLEALKEKYEIIGEVRGKGPMLGIELVKDRERKQPAAEETQKLIKLCFEKGLLLLSCGNLGNVIRILMPFVITDEALERGICILEESFHELNS